MIPRKESMKAESLTLMTVRNPRKGFVCSPGLSWTWGDILIMLKLQQ